MITSKDLKQLQENNLNKAVNNAISSWTDASKGVFHSGNSYAKGYSKEYCLIQVDYFKTTFKTTK